MDTARIIKFNIHFKTFLDFLKHASSERGGILDDTLQLMNVTQPCVLRKLFDIHVRQPYGSQIMACDTTVFDDIRSSGDDYLSVTDLWYSPEFDERKKAQCFQHLIQICQTY